jgi:AcrR family transcriptional regulator
MSVLMESRVRKRLSPQERRAKILSAAVRAFARDGYDGTKMDGIAARAQITKPVLYDHFSSKQALFLTVLEAIRDGLIAKGKSIVEAGGDPEQTFRRAVDAFLQFVEREPDAARVLLTVPSGDPLAAKLSRKVQASASADLGALLVTFMPESAPWRLQAATEFLKEGLHAVAIWWLANPGPPREEIVDVITRIVWPGLRTGVRSVGTQRKRRAVDQTYEGNR